jgi:hypothetical protein
MEEIRNVHTILVGKCEGNRPLRRPRRKWEDYMKMNLKEIRSEDVEWIHVA